MHQRRFPGLASQIKHARTFVARCVGDIPELTTAVLLTSEVATNAVTHTNSGHSGGKFEVTVRVGRRWLRVEVRDLGSGQTPQAMHRKPHDVHEHGRGLDLVAALATRWEAELRADGLGHIVWFELTWDADATDDAA
ncbi:ATP-binding protein [Lipingzhangella sp. LS1_29]|uniref:ATP-binding protein n=1 Tax=Lipingzhangella rawalii TaxID=2055835 RepID=A0ABU2H9L4_9ACTN|nr:ATP-binding protein [Lipingzhangella rawalii]MDS1271971.1 ATP-binding protein [Lipingzhangella rawalii]